MSLRQKISLGFLISVSVMSLLVLLGYLNFIEIRKEIKFLELSDTIRSKTLQLRRHEKNYFLYRTPAERDAIFIYLEQINTILRKNDSGESGKKLHELKAIVDEYGMRFGKIEDLMEDFQQELGSLKMSHNKDSALFTLIEATSLENPLISIRVLQQLYSLPEDNVMIRSLKDLDDEINALRRTGEEIILFSKELDKSGREKADRALYLTQAATLFALPVFLIVGLGISFTISHGIVKRLNMVAEAVEKTSHGTFSHISGVSQHEGRDEVDILMRKFNQMGEQLEEREKELLQSKKLVAIGTLASGVAHELNNPLSNIYTTAQRLQKKVGDECPVFIRKGLDDIFDQSMRVKKIVGDLLEFARGRDPQPRKVEINELIRNAYLQTSNVVNAEKVKASMESTREKVIVSVDPEQMEQVFINLFRNAVEAMSGEGKLTVSVEPDDNLIIEVTDTGRGMSEETVEKIFEPFFTTKDKGTGLGLAIIYNIIKKHNGDIQVTSEEGKGTKFTITLPLEKE